MVPPCRPLVPSGLQNVGVDLARSLLTGVLPSVLGLVWTSVAMPHLLYLCSSLARR